MPFADDGLPLRLAGEKPSLIQEAEKALNRVRAKISGDVQERAFAEARETLDAMERWFEEALRSNPAQESAAQDRYEISDSEAESLQNRQAEVWGDGPNVCAVRSTPVPQRNTPGKQVSQAVRTVMGA